MRRIKTYASSFGFDFHACVHYREKVPVSVDEIYEHIPENCFKHKVPGSLSIGGVLSLYESIFTMFWFLVIGKTSRSLVFIIH